MIHEMRLHLAPFYEIKRGRNTREVRLNDDKRRKVSVGDFIIFKMRPDYKESVKVKVLEIKKYPTYNDILKSFKDKSNISLDYYSKDDVSKYGFVVFEIKVVK